MSVNAEKIVKDYLEAELDVWVGGSTPKNTNQSWVRITQLDDRNVAGQRTDHFNSHFLQLDCYASGDGIEYQVEAGNLYRQARAALVAMPNETISGVVVTAVTFGACPRIPDESFEPPRQRYIIDCFLYAHPA